MSRFGPTIIALLSVVLSVFASGALAAPARMVPGGGAGFREGRYMLAPQAFIVFCRDNPAECRETDREPAVAAGADLHGLLREVNDRVNRTIAPVAQSGIDVWSLGRRSGHCATYAVEKRHELLKAGLPANAVSLAVVMTSWGELHLVVAVRTDRGTVVLDNLRRDIVTWTETGYSFQKVQSAGNPNFWVSVHGPASPEKATIFAWSASSTQAATSRFALVARGSVEMAMAATSAPIVTLQVTDQDRAGRASLDGARPDLT